MGQMALSDGVCQGMGGHWVAMTWAHVEFALGQLIGNGFDQRLIRRFAAAQAIETDLICLKVYFGANQPMLP